MRAWKIVVALTLAGCAHVPTAAEREAEATRVGRLARVTPGEQAHALLVAFQHPEACKPAAWIRLVALDDLDPTTPECVESSLPVDAPAEVVGAAALGLGYSKADAAEKLLVELALRPSQPPEAVEALFSYYRYRGPDKPPPATLPDDRLLAYAKHPRGRGRAALGHLGRVVKDPALIEVMTGLAVSDPDFEVRRAALLALAEGMPKKERPADQRATCLAVLAHCLNDADARVVAAACRAVASYDDPSGAPLLVFKLGHADFNVRVAALEGLGKRKATEAIDAMKRVARTDPSTSCRYAAATQLAAIDPAAAQELVDGLLKDASEYVRSAGVEVLAKSEDLTATPRLATVAKTDPHVRVRETAVGAFEGKKDSQIAKDAVKAALADSDVGVVSTACSVAGRNEWTEFADALAAVPSRFPGCLGADAREAALSALADLDAEPRRALFESHVHDANPAVRAAAEKAVAKLDKTDPPKTPTRGADLSGSLLPGGAPIFDEDAFLVIETDQGTMKVRLFHEEAPVHCAHVASFAMAGGYDGLTWHRVVPDFVIQGGCPRGDGSGNAGVTLPLEPTRIPFERGTLGMPRSDHPDTGGCQLFICHSRAPHLDVRYTAFGKVVEGLDVIDRIDVDGKIVRVRVEGVR